MCILIVEDELLVCQCLLCLCIELVGVWVWFDVVVDLDVVGDCFVCSVYDGLFLDFNFGGEDGFDLLCCVVVG